MKGPLASGRIDPRVMDRLVAAASLKVAAAFGVGADAIGAACSTRADGSGFVASAIGQECAVGDR